MSRINETHTLPFGSPYLPIKGGGGPDYDLHTTHRSPARPHYHACNHDHSSDHSDFRPDQYDPYMRDYRPARHFPERYRDWDYRPDRGLPETRRDWDYRPDRGLPETRRDWDYRPDRSLSQTRRDWDYLPDRRANLLSRHSCIDGCTPKPIEDITPKKVDNNSTVEAFQKLIDTVPETMISYHQGVTAEGLRAGKYGALTPAIARELTKLDANKDYRMVTQNNNGLTTTSWIPVDGGDPIPIETIGKKGVIYPKGGSEITKLTGLNANLPRITEYGITSDFLHNKQHLQLPPEIQASLNALEKNKNYTLIEVQKSDFMPRIDLGWLEKTTGQFVNISQREGGAG